MRTVQAAVRALAANANTSSFASRIPTITEPTGAGIFTFKEGPGGNPLGFSETIVPDFMKLWPIGLSANDDAFSMRVLGWNHIGEGATPNKLWIPSIIGEFACTMGNVTGIAAAPVLNTEFFCDVITPVAARLLDRDIAAGTAVNSDYFILNPGGDLIGFVIMPTFGFEKFEFQFDQTTNTPTMNVLVAGLSEAD